VSEIQERRRDAAVPKIAGNDLRAASFQLDPLPPASFLKIIDAMAVALEAHHAQTGHVDHC
jgi:hypothetical protein